MKIDVTSFDSDLLKSFKSFFYKVLKLLLLALLSLGSFFAYGQTMGLASAVYLDNQEIQASPDILKPLVSDMEAMVLDCFFEAGYIGFNIPALYILPDEVALPSEGSGKISFSHKENLQFINLAETLRRGGASKGVVLQAELNFQSEPARVNIKSLKISLLDLSPEQNSAVPLLKTKELPIDSASGFSKLRPALEKELLKLLADT